LRENETEKKKKNLGIEGKCDREEEEEPRD
jgi:hypothetical protein